ncbi:hypothetical protein RQN30_01470 [Arcanobacterium hippocoleae]
MATDINSTFTRLQNAFEEFHSAVIQFQDSEAPAVLRAIEQLSDAYTVYDDAIFTEYGVEAPFDTFTEDDYDDDDFDDDEFDDIDEIDDADDTDDEFDYLDDEYDEFTAAEYESADE